MFVCLFNLQINAFIIYAADGVFADGDLRQ